MTHLQHICSRAVDSVLVLILMLTVVSCSGNPTGGVGGDLTVPPEIGLVPELEADQSAISGYPVLRNMRPEPRELYEGYETEDLSTLVSPNGVDAGDWEALISVFKAQLEEKSVRSSAGDDKAKFAIPTDLRVERNDSGQAHLLWSYANRGDYDQNGQTNSSDLVKLAHFLGRDLSSPDWDQAQVADGDLNGQINLADVTPIAQNLGTTVFGYQVNSSTNNSTWALAGYAWLEDAKLPDVTGMKRFTIDLQTANPEGYWQVIPFLQDEDGLPSKSASALPTDSTAVPVPYLWTIASLDSKSASDANANRNFSEVTELPVGATVYCEEDHCLYKVVNSSGKADLSPAELADAWQFLDLNLAPGNYDVDVSFVPSSEDVEFEMLEAKSASDISVGKEWEVRFDKVVNPNLSVVGKVSGRLELQMDLNFGGFWHTGKMERFYIGENFDADVTAQLDIHGQIHKDFNLPLGYVFYQVRYYPSPPPVPPIVIVIKLPVTLVGKASADSGIRFGPAIGFKHSLGLEYTAESNKWTPVTDALFKPSLGFDREWYIGAELEAALQGRLEILLYNAIGPYIELQGPLTRARIERSVGKQSEWNLTVDGGGKMYVGVTENIPFLKVPGMPKKLVYEKVVRNYLRIWNDPAYYVSEIEVDPLEINRELKPGQSGTATATISNAGNADLTWSLSDSAPWFVAMPTGGTIAPGSEKVVTMNYTVPNSKGVYTVPVTITSNDPEKSSIQIIVNLTVADINVPDISVNSTSISKTLQPGQSGSEVLTIANSGNSNLTWNASENVSWMSLSPTSGSVSQGSQSSMTVNFNAPGSQGTYTGNVTISSNDPDENPVTIPVTLTVNSGSNSSVEIANVPDSGKVSGDIEVAAEFNGAGATLNKAEFYLGGSKIDTQYSVYKESNWIKSNTINLLAYADGWYFLKVVVTDSSQNVCQDEIQVYIHNGDGFTSGTYKAHQTYQSDYILYLSPGQTGYVTVTFQNQGTAAWFNYGANPVRLASSNHINGWTLPTDNVSDFWTPDWLKDDRINVLGGNAGYFECAPGNSVTWTIPVHVPSNMPPGEYYPHWNLVADFLQWIPDKNGAEYGDYFVKIVVQ